MLKVALVVYRGAESVQNENTVIQRTPHIGYLYCLNNLRRNGIINERNNNRVHQKTSARASENQPTKLAAVISLWFVLFEFLFIVVLGLCNVL